VQAKARATRRPARCDHLFLDAADGEDQPAQRNFAGHRVSLRTARPVSRDASAVNIATPALGPSFGVAPAGTWIWMSLFSNPLTSIPIELRDS
jgi:hypothetical protein